MQRDKQRENEIGGVKPNGKLDGLGAERTIEERGDNGSGNRYEHVRHGFDPVYDSESQILILGSFPSVKSRQNNFFYGNPQNRFWKVIAALTCWDVPEDEDIDGKKDMLLANRIALWDVIESCDIVGSSDSSIKNVVPNDIGSLLEHTSVERIFANGRTAQKLYDKYLLKTLGREITPLPSTSPANASYGLEKLVDIWGRELDL